VRRPIVAVMMVGLVLAIAWVALMWRFLAHSPFEDRYPLDRALGRVEKDGLILAVHAFRPVGDGRYYVVSSIRATPEHLHAFPPRRIQVNLLNSEIVGPTESSYLPWEDDRWIRRVEMARAESDGVQYTWWLLSPRRYFKVEDGRRVDAEASVDSRGVLPIELGAGRFRVPIAASHRDRARLDEKGMERPVYANIEVEVPSTGPRWDLEMIAGQVRGDLESLSRSTRSSLFAVTKPPKIAHLSPLKRVEPRNITDSGYANIIRALIEDNHRVDVTAKDPAAIQELIDK
jgi:hypothetical protein